MNTKLMMIGALAVACAGRELAAMPTEEEARKAEPVVKRLMASNYDALKSGRKTGAEVAVAAMKLAGQTGSEAEKLLLMKGAFSLYVRSGEFDKAVETVEAMQAAIPDIPKENVISMIKSSMRNIPRNDGKLLYVLLDDIKSGRRNADGGGKNVSNVKYKFNYKLEDGGAVLTGISPKPVGTLVVPDEIDGHIVTRIENYNEFSPFWGCDQLTKVVLPAGLKFGSCDGGPFMSCKSLATIDVAEGNKELTSRDGALYSKDLSTLCVYPKTRESVELPPETKKVGVCAFRGCALKTAKIPEGVEEIERWNLCECPNLEIIEFPKSLKKLGVCAAYNNEKLTKVVFLGDAPEVRGGWQEVFTGAPENLVVEVYKGSKGWKSPDSTDLPERWPADQKESRPIRYGEKRAEWLVAQYNGPETSPVVSLAGAQELVEQSPKVAEQTYKTLSFGNNDNKWGDFAHVEFPGTSESVDMNNFAITAVGSIRVPSAGEWTFACRGDDGFRFVIAGREFSETIEHDGIRGLWQKPLLHTVKFPSAGVYSVNCLYFEKDSNAGLEFSVARGKQSSFDPSVFKLVGDPESGIVMVETAK